MHKVIPCQLRLVKHSHYSETLAVITFVKIEFDIVLLFFKLLLGYIQLVLCGDDFTDKSRKLMRGKGIGH